MSPKMWGYCVLNTTEVRMVHDEVGVGNRGLGNPMIKDMGGLVWLCKTREVDPEWMEGPCCFWLCPERRRKHRKLEGLRRVQIRFVF